MKNVFKFEDFKVGAMEINGHQVEVTGVYKSGELNGWSGYHITAAVDGGEVKAWRVSRLCAEVGVEYAKTFAGKASGTTVKVTSEDRIKAKAQVAYKAEAQGLEALEAAGLLSGEALKEAKAALDAKIKAEEERLTAEAVAEKAKKAEAAEAKKAKKDGAKKVGKVCELLDQFDAQALRTLLKCYIGTREDAKAIMEVVTKEQVTE